MSTSNPRIIYLTAGAAGMYCGSCMQDNAIAKTLSEQGWDIQLVPTYTPIRTDETNVSVDQIFFGGINVFLQQKIPLFRYLPAGLDRFLDNPKLIRRVTSKSINMDAHSLGKLTVSMLKGMQGNQRKEVKRLCRWLKSEQPDLILFSNLLIGGCIEHIKQRLGVPVLVMLQGDDVFLDSLEEPYRSRCMEQMRRIATSVDGFIVHSQFYCERMSSYFEIEADRIHVVPLGIAADSFQNLKTTRVTNKSSDRHIGYLARLSPEKGLQHLVSAFIELKRRTEFTDVKLQIAGWLGSDQESFAEAQWQRLQGSGLENEYTYLGELDHDEKLKFLSQIDIFSVPTDFKEPKGRYALEAMAAGVPVVQPAHGAFPELIDQSAGGLLFEPNNIAELVDRLATLLKDETQRKEMGQAGFRFVQKSRSLDLAALAIGQVIRSHVHA